MALEFYFLTVRGEEKDQDSLVCPVPVAEGLLYEAFSSVVASKIRA